MTTPVIERQTVHISDDTGRVAMWEHRTVGAREEDNDTDETLVRYSYSNHLQSAALELDQHCTVISYEEYHPYGTTSFQANNADVKATAKRYRYTGKERDEESGLYYHGARYYIPWLGRWSAVDPLEAEYAGWSPYHYVKCNPVMDTDSTGMGGDSDLQGKVPKAVKNGGVAGGFVSSSGTPASAKSIVLDEVKVREYKDRGPGEYHYKMRMSDDGTANLKLESFRNKNSHSFLGLFHWDTPIDSKRYIVDFDFPGEGNKRYYIGFPQYGKGYANAWKAEEFENDYLKNSGDPVAFIQNYATENGSYAASTAFYAINAQNRMMEAAIPMVEGSSIRTKTFYTVQGPEDAARLRSTGTPWPNSPTRAHMGEGVYSWGTIAEAEAYLAVSPGKEIVEFSITEKLFNKLNKFEVPIDDDPANIWLGKHSSLFGEGAPHGYDYIIRQTGMGPEHYFNKNIFSKLKFKP